MTLRTPALTSLALLAVTAGPALSLSCMKPDPARSYTQAAEAEEAYLVVHGKLSHNPDAVPERKSGEQPISFPATLTGAFLQADGFHGAFAAPLTVTVDCAMTWCGEAPESSVDVLAYLQETPTGYALTLGPCGGWMFTDPTTEDLDRVVSCHTGGDCTPQD